MIDENLPTFFLKNSSQTPNQSTIYYRQHGNDPEPAYNLRYLDPKLPAARNRYGVALYDPYVPEVVYGEVAVIPEWTQPTLSAEAIRANGGTAPAPEPILPTEFAIQLYNPDQQIVIKHQPKTWNKPARWEFEMPQRTFRVPSASTLDRTQSDPAAADITPKLRFSWRKDGKLSKDLSCLLHGKSSTIPDTRTKTREPDITVALFQGLRELTLYEPNLYRVEMEDFKGLEVVLLLAAVAIKDIFFGLAKEAFHIVAGAPPVGAIQPQAGVPPGQKGQATQSQKPAGAGPIAVANGKPSPPRLTIPQTQPQKPSPASAPQPQAKPQPRPRQDAQAKKEAQRTQELLAAEKRAEEKARRKRQAEIDAETKRLQKLYGHEEQQVRANANANKLNPTPSSRPHLPPRHTGPSRPYSHNYSQSYSHLPVQQPLHQQRPPAPPTFASTPHMNTHGRLDPRAQSTTHLTQPRPQQMRPQSAVGFYQVAGGGLAPVPESGFGGRPQQQQQTLAPKKSSFFGFRRKEEGGGGGGERPRNKLDKKRSSMF